MNIPQLHTNLLWDLSCLIIFLTGLYFSCIIFFRSPFWKSIASTTYFLEWGDLGRFRICSLHKDKQTSHIDYQVKGNCPENVNVSVDQEPTINDIEVDYEVVIDPTLERQIHEILESYTREQREREIIFYEENEVEMLDFGNITLPTAKFYSKKEHKRVKLLHAIAELGDLREVPLLQGMLNQERNESISILIKEIILGFLSESRTDEGNGESETPEIGPLCEHYVYKYLFRAIDTESKYLLLDEILNIGGSEELVFLRSLSQHPDEGIREKAMSIGDQLERKLHSPQHDAITGIDIPMPKGTDLKNRFLSHLTGIWKEMGYKFFKKRSITKDELDSKGKNRPDILQIDFELDMPGAEDRKKY